jgi:GSH-dependent disulfide-bond oxidoreductase
MDQVTRPNPIVDLITLYGMSSPNVRKVIIALEEMALPYRIEHVSVFRGRQFDPEILALNPMAKVPILIDPDGPAGEMPIFESGAILVYLAENHGPAFLPASGAARYCVLKWLFMQVANVGPALGNNSHFRMIADDNAYAAQRFRRMSAQVYRALDQRLSEARYLGGDAYSIADMAAWPWARYFRRHGMRDDDCPRLVEWIARIGQRPAVGAAGGVMAALGERDRQDRAAASPEELAMLTGQHIPAPSASEAAAGLPASEKGAAPTDN